jgi:hypothetical protein
MHPILLTAVVKVGFRLSPQADREDDRRSEIYRNGCTTDEFDSHRWGAVIIFDYGCLASLVDSDAAGQQLSRDLRAYLASFRLDDVTRLYSR